MSRPQKHTGVDPRKKTISMPNNRVENLDTKKEISIPKRRLRPPRYHKKDISIPKKDSPNISARRVMGSVCAVALSHTISRLVPVLADNGFLAPAVRSQPLNAPMLSRKAEQLMHRLPIREPRIRRKPRVNLKAKTVRLNLQPRVVTSTLTRLPRLIKMNLTSLKGKTMIKKKIPKPT